MHWLKQSSYIEEISGDVYGASSMSMTARIAPEASLEDSGSTRTNSKELRGTVLQEDFAGNGEDFDDRHLVRVQALWRGNKARSALVLPVVQFSTTIYYASEGEGDMMIDIVRLGPAATESRVDYSTDPSVHAGKKFVPASGTALFAPGETMVSRAGFMIGAAYRLLASANFAELVLGCIEAKFCK